MIDKDRSPFVKRGPAVGSAKLYPPGTEPRRYTYIYYALLELLVLDQHDVAREHHQPPAWVLILERREVLWVMVAGWSSSSGNGGKNEARKSDCSSHGHANSVTSSSLVAAPGENSVTSNGIGSCSSRESHCQDGRARIGPAATPTALTQHQANMVDRANS